jgi:predicted RNA binding protein YcfA (HicA-like mRNA interferase family)
MSEKLPVISGKDFIKLLESLGFGIIRINGSHYRLKHSDGRITTVPVHKNDSLPKGLLRKILREDIEITVEELHALIKNKFL